MKALYWIIASLVTLSGLGTMAIGAGKMKAQKPTYSSSKESYEGIKNLDIDLGSEELTVISTADAKSCTVELCEVSDRVIVSQDGDILRISYKPNSDFQLFAFQTPNSKVIITLPEDVLGSVKLDNGSGGMCIEHLKADTIKAETGSGGIAVKDTESRVGEIRTGSGGMAIADTTFSEDAKLHSGSGGIAGQSFAAPGKLSLDTGSGSVKMEGVTAGKTTAVSGSGSLHLTNLTLTDTSSFKAGSGSIELTLAGDPADYIVSTQSGSGQTQIEGLDKEKHADAVNVTTVTGSGNVKVFFERNQAE